MSFVPSRGCEVFGGGKLISVHHFSQGDTHTRKIENNSYQETVNWDFLEKRDRWVLPGKESPLRGLDNETRANQSAVSPSQVVRMVSENL